MYRFKARKYSRLRYLRRRRPEHGGHKLMYALSANCPNGIINCSSISFLVLFVCFRTFAIFQNGHLAGLMKNYGSVLNPSRVLTCDDEEKGFPVDAGSQGVVERPPREVPQVEGFRDTRVTLTKQAPAPSVFRHNRSGDTTRYTTKRERAFVLLLLLPGKPNLQMPAEKTNVMHKHTSKGYPVASPLLHAD